MDVLWLVLAIILMLVGIAGSILPILPGPPLSYAALLLLQLRSDPPFTTKFLLIWAGVTLVVTVLDFVIPMYGTKRFGGSKYGIWGCTVGLLLGLFIPPWGIIIGPFLGAFIGELIYTDDSSNAFRAAVGSFAGFVFGTLLKLVACLVMLYYFVVAL